MMPRLAAALHVFQRPWLATAVLAVAGCGFVLLGLGGPVNPYDEGFILYGADRVTHGDVPYRDFWSIYPPGQFWLNAAAFELVGPSVLVARLADGGVRVALLLTIYLFARAIVGPRAALVPWAIAAVWIATLGFYGYPIVGAMAAVLASAWCIATGVLGGHRPRLLAGGVLLGIGAIWRHDVAAYAAVATLVSVVLAGVTRVGERRMSWRDLVIVGAGAATPVVMASAYLLLAVPAPLLWQQLFDFPATTQRWARHQPPPGLIPPLNLETPRATLWLLFNWGRFYALLVVVVGTLTWAAVRLPRAALHAPERTRAWLIAFAALLGASLLPQATGRYDSYQHAFPASMLAAIAGTGVAVAVWSAQSGRFLRTAVLATAAAVVVAYGAAPIYSARAWVARYQPWHCRSHLDRAGCLDVPADLTQAVDAVRACTHPGEPIFVGNDRHDQIYRNDMMLYFLADRPAPTQYQELYPGLATTRPVQATIIRGIQERGVRVVVTWDRPLSIERNGSSESSGVTDLDQFVRAAFRPEVRFGDYTVWSRIEDFPLGCRAEFQALRSGSFSSGSNAVH
jgi:hypothetical protein